MNDVERDRVMRVRRGEGKVEVIATKMQGGNQKPGPPNVGEKIVTVGNEGRRM